MHVPFVSILSFLELKATIQREKITNKGNEGSVFSRGLFDVFDLKTRKKPSDGV